MLTSLESKYAFYFCFIHNNTNYVVLIANLKLISLDARLKLLLKPRVRIAILMTDTALDISSNITQGKFEVIN